MKVLEYQGTDIDLKFWRIEQKQKGKRRKKKTQILGRHSRGLHSDQSCICEKIKYNSGRDTRILHIIQNRKSWRRCTHFFIVEHFRPL